MRNYIIPIILIASLAIVSCSDEGVDESKTVPNTSSPGRALYQAGSVEVKFTKTVTQTKAEDFIQGFNLVLKRFDGQNDSTHLGLVQVPVGMEQVWVDSLKSFPSIIEGASLVPMMYTD